MDDTGHLYGFNSFSCGMKITFLPMNLFASEAEWPHYISTFSDVITNQCLIFKTYINQVTKPN